MSDREKLIELLWDCAYIEGYGTDLREKEADHLISNGVTVQKRIPVSERLPKFNQPCLCYKKTHGQDEYKLGTYLGSTFSDKCAAFKSMSHYGVIGATHWMPLPEPPKGCE